MIVTLRKSKTGLGREIQNTWMPVCSSELMCPVRSLQAQLESAGILDGTVVRSLDRVQRAEQEAV